MEMEAQLRCHLECRNRGVENMNCDRVCSRGEGEEFERKRVLAGPLRGKSL